MPSKLHFQGSVISTGIRPKSLAAADAAEEEAEDVEEIESSVQGFYDNPNALNFHMQVRLA